jgi:hypothetical protein
MRRIRWAVRRTVRRRSCSRRPARRGRSSPDRWAGRGSVRPHGASVTRQVDPVRAVAPGAAGQHPAAAFPAGVHGTEAGRDERDEDAWLAGHGVGDALAAAQPGEDQLVGVGPVDVGPVDLGARGADGRPAAPRSRQGFRGMIRCSSAAVMRTARSSRYAFAAIVIETPLSRSVDRHSRTVSVSIFVTGTAPRYGAMCCEAAIGTDDNARAQARMRRTHTTLILQCGRQTKNDSLRRASAPGWPAITRTWVRLRVRQRGHPVAPPLKA